MTTTEARALAQALVQTQPQPAVQATLAWSAVVDVEPRRELGPLLSYQLAEIITAAIDARLVPFRRLLSLEPDRLFLRSRPIIVSSGGSVFNVTLNLIDHGMTMQQAIDAPRISVTSALGTVSCEGGQGFMQPPLVSASFAGLSALGHLMPDDGACLSSIGSVQGVVIDPQTGAQQGGADPRREGTVIRLPR